MVQACFKNLGPQDCFTYFVFILFHNHSSSSSCKYFCNLKIVLSVWLKWIWYQNDHKCMENPLVSVSMAISASFYIYRPNKRCTLRSATQRTERHRNGMDLLVKMGCRLVKLVVQYLCMWKKMDLAISSLFLSFFYHFLWAMDPPSSSFINISQPPLDQSW